MAYKTVTTVVTNPETEKHALETAVDIAKQNGGHLDALCLGIDHTQPGFYYAGAAAMAMQSSLSEAESQAEKISGKVKEILEGRDLNYSVESLVAQTPGLAQFIGYHLRFSDLTVHSRPYGEGRLQDHEAIVEAALFDARVPVLVMPNGVKMPSAPRCAVVAWNESREALTAVRAAMPLLVAADRVNVVIVDPPAHAPDRSDPGGLLSQMLARHGANAEVSVLAKTLPRVSDVIARHVAEQGAELLVMGAYGHSRFRESILGGATRNMLQIADVPLLMAH